MRKITFTQSDGNVLYAVLVREKIDVLLFG